MRTRTIQRVTMLATVLLATACAAPAAQPQGPAPAAQPPGPAPAAAEVLSPLAVVSLAPIDPVLGADDRVHLAYELLLANQASSTVQLTTVVTLAGETPVTTLEGPALGSRFRPSSGATGTSLGPGESGYLFLDATLAPGAPLPRTVRHRVAMTQQSTPPRSLTVTGVPVPVSDRPAVEVAPPLRGSGWVVGNGCCDAVNGHRGATLSIDGTVHVAERFAIDFIRLDPAGTLYSGDPALNASFPYFGAEVHSVASGTVVGTNDGQPEQVPGVPPVGQTVQTAGGNYVVVDIGGGRFAFYAHLQPGSLRVKVGDRVGTADVLGLLGNSGNTDAPHLHFHVMDSPSPLTSNGLPFVFTSFTGQGVVPDEAGLLAPFPPTAPVVPVDAARLAGPHATQLPLNLQLIDLG